MLKVKTLVKLMKIRIELKSSLDNTDNEHDKKYGKLGESGHYH